MSSKKKTLLTLGERLSLMSGSPALSPGTAAKLVQRFSQASVDGSFCKDTGFDAMRWLIGNMTWPNEEPLYYGSFCKILRSAFESENDISKWPRPETLQDMDPYRLAFGVKATNAIILLGEILLDHARGLMPNNDVYNCLQMTLGQYLDALTDLSFREDGTLDRSRAEACSALRELLLNDYEGSTLLEEVIAKLIRRYKESLQEFDHLDHVLRCMGGLACYVEENGDEVDIPKADFRLFREALYRYSPSLEGRDLVDQDKRYLNPCGYYFTLANEYHQEDKPKFSLISPYSEFFFSERDYSPETLRPLAALCPAEDLRIFLEKIISGERLPLAMQMVNRIVFYLYAMWVEPYLQIEEYQYKEHLETRPP